MNPSSWTLAKGKFSTPQKIIFAVFAFLFCTFIFTIFPAQGIDWRVTFYQVARVPLHPYSVKTFVNLPWTALILYPFQFFSVNLSQSINASLNLIIIGLLVIKRKGDNLSLILALTSFPFLSLLANGSIEWIPALGFVLQNQWGVLLLLTKPQSGIFAALGWVSSNKNKLWLFFVPAILMMIASLILWPKWPMEMLTNIQYMQDVKMGLFMVNVSLWPWTIPFGLGLLWFMFKLKPVDKELLGILATFLLTPYFVPHSLTILFALLSVSHRRIAIVAWFLLWSYPILLNLPRIIHLLRL